VRALPGAVLAVLAACACREEPTRQVDSPAATPAAAATTRDTAGDAGAPAPDGGRRAPPAGAEPDGGGRAPTGRLCVAPLDYSDTPGKGAMSMEAFREFGEPSPTARNARAVVTVNGRRQEITLKKGARFDGLPLDAPFEVTIAGPGGRPYFGKKISFEKEGADALCLYENAFYSTVQLSAVPRRPFCRKCMKADAP
jgi:hypothetical protein